MPPEPEHEEQQMMQADRAWRIDKHIPLAPLIGGFMAILAQTVTIVWWGASINYRVDALEKQYVVLAPLAGTLIEVKTTLDNLKDDVKDIKATLRQSSQH